MHNIYLLQKFVLDHTVMLLTNSTHDGIYNRLGKEVLKVKPSCAIQVIRNSFHSENKEYTPFI